jgi:flagellar hook assembly protein FlgD
VKIHVYNINGQLVQTLVNDHQTAGFYSVNWNSAGLASGIYLYQIVAGDFQKVRKCMVIK